MDPAEEGFPLPSQTNEEPGREFPVMLHREAKNLITSNICSCCLMLLAPADELWSATSAVTASIAVLNECPHVFHSNCLVAWAGIENSCPHCKRRFRLVGLYQITINAPDLKQRIIDVDDKVTDEEGLDAFLFEDQSDFTVWTFGWPLRLLDIISVNERNLGDESLEDTRLRRICEECSSMDATVEMVVCSGRGRQCGRSWHWWCLGYPKMPEALQLGEDGSHVLFYCEDCMTRHRCSGHWRAGRFHNESVLAVRSRQRRMALGEDVDVPEEPLLQSPSNGECRSRSTSPPRRRLTAAESIRIIEDLEPRRRRIDPMPGDILQQLMGTAPSPCDRSPEEEGKPHAKMPLGRKRVRPVARTKSRKRQLVTELALGGDMSLWREVEPERTIRKGSAADPIVVDEIVERVGDEELVQRDSEIPWNAASFYKALDEQLRSQLARSTRFRDARNGQRPEKLRDMCKTVMREAGNKLCAHEKFRYQFMKAMATANTDGEEDRVRRGLLECWSRKTENWLDSAITAQLITGSHNGN